MALAVSIRKDSGVHVTLRQPKPNCRMSVSVSAGVRNEKGASCTSGSSYAAQCGDEMTVGQ